jgi:hypothetical protein
MEYNHHCLVPPPLPPPLHPPCRHLISLTSWTLQLCPSDAPVQAADGQAEVSVDVSKDGVSVDVSGLASVLGFP